MQLRPHCHISNMGAVLGKRFFAQANQDPNETMDAITYSRYGEAEQVLEFSKVPRPLPDPAKHVFIQVHGSGLNPVDFKFRAHPLPAFFIPKPKIPGGDVSGTVISAPPNSGFVPGDRVCALMPLLGTTWGSSAQFAAIEQSLVAHVPPNIPLEEAAALPLVGLTVLEGFRSVLPHLGVTQGKKVFIQAGSGGVGSVAIQYCKHVLGMYVATTCSERNREFVEALGADEIIDYRTESFEERIRDFDVVFDVLAYANESKTMSSRMLKASGGHYIHIAASDWDQSSQGSDLFGLAIPEARPERILWSVWSNVRYGLGHLLGTCPRYHGPVFVHPDGKALREFMTYVEQGKIRPCIDQRYSLQETAQAHVYLEQGHAKGKVIIVIKEE